MKKKDPGNYANPESDFLCVRSLSCIVLFCVSRWGRTYIFIVTSIEIIVQVEVGNCESS